jgi:hypothetical protein
MGIVFFRYTDCSSSRVIEPHTMQAFVQVPVARISTPRDGYLNVNESAEILKNSERRSCNDTKLRFGE